MTTMSNLPRDLVEDVISRVPVTSLTIIRSTCKKWNTLSKDESFTKKHLSKSEATATEKKEFLAVVLINYSLHLMSVNLHNEDFYPSINPRGKLFSLMYSDKQLEITRVCHCKGLLLCTMKDYTRLVVWNPYSGQTRWICVEPSYVHHRLHRYGHALGYDMSNSHKILRFAYAPSERSVHEIYDLSSNTWRVLDDDVIIPDWRLEYGNSGLSLKGNTYWFAMDNSRGTVPDFLLCFDFTTERFTPRLPLPFMSYCPDVVTLSSVREEQLAVLFQDCQTLDIEIWVTTKIEPEAVSWSKFFVVDTGGPFNGLQLHTGGGFLIDGEKRAVVVFGEEKEVKQPPTRHIAYIFREHGLEEVDLGEITTDNDGFLHACSYVPSSVFF